MRIVVTATVLALACLAQAGCSGGRVEGAGADPAQAGPETVLTPSPDPVVTAPGLPETTERPATSPPVPTGPVQTMPGLASAITTEISDPARHGTPGVRVQRRKFAQYQIIIGWTVTSLAGDPAAPGLARTDAVRILQLVQRTRLPRYGSVLLIVTGAVAHDGDGGRKMTRVVRAKYTAEAVRGTVFAPGTVWAQADDKAAEVNPAFG
ncbi:hypothetical protein [Actinocorallia longicatena]|uniref:Uncharacterized protein n=1 Tax=Actinocorallia longicatena TaxID=111803 RepID=A0ABP6Q4W2_9ACTN